MDYSNQKYIHIIFFLNSHVQCVRIGMGGGGGGGNAVVVRWIASLLCVYMYSCRHFFTILNYSSYLLTNVDAPIEVLQGL